VITEAKRPRKFLRKNATDILNEMEVTNSLARYAA
jgi:hypothetical protein